MIPPSPSTAITTTSTTSITHNNAASYVPELPPNLSKLALVLTTPSSSNMAVDGVLVIKNYEVSEKTTPFIIDSLSTIGPSSSTSSVHCHGECPPGTRTGPAISKEAVPKTFIPIGAGNNAHTGSLFSNIKCRLLESPEWTILSAMPCPMQTGTPTCIALPVSVGNIYPPGTLVDSVATVEPASIPPTSSVSIETATGSSNLQTSASTTKSSSFESLTKTNLNPDTPSVVTTYPVSSLTLTSQEICAIANNIITIVNLIRNATVMDGTMIIPSFSMIGNRVVSTVTSMVLSLQIINTISLLLTSCGASSILSTSHLPPLDRSITSSNITPYVSKSILYHSASSSADTHPEYCSGTPPTNADDGGQKESTASKLPPSCQIKCKQQCKRLATSMIPNKPAVKTAKGEKGSGLPKLGAREAEIMVNLSEIPQSVLLGDYTTESCSGESSQGPPSCQIKLKPQRKGSFTSTTPDDKAGKYKPAVKRARG